MPRFEQIADASQDAELDELYRDILAHGFGGSAPINWLTSQSTRPDILAGTWAFSKSLLVEGHLPAAVKQMIAAVIAVQNNCGYCSHLHSNTLGMMGVSRAIIESCVTDPDLAAVKQPHRAILQFALKVVRSPAALAAEDVETLRGYGISTEEILEIVAIAAYCSFINTWADISGIEVEPQGDPG